MMETAPQTLLIKAKEILTIAVLIILGVFLTYGILSMKKADLVLDEVNKTVIQSNALVADTQKNLKGTFQNVNAILIQTGLAADQVRRLSETETVAITGYSQQVSSLLDGLNGTVTNVNSAVATLQENVSKVSQSANEAVLAIPPVLEQGKLTLATTNQTMASLNTVVSDPNVQRTLDNVQQTTVNVNNSTKRIDDQIKIWTKPKNTLMKILDTTLSIGSRAALIIK